MADVCEKDGCERPQRARQLCEMHYMQLKRAGLGPLRRKQPRQAEGLKRDCQLGQNFNCVDCGQKPYGGGMRCLTCFQVRCEERAEKSAHACGKHAAGTSCYSMCKCRCGECRDAIKMYARQRRAA
jgi:hypothetical protein